MKMNVKSTFSIFGCLLISSLLSFMSIPINLLLKGAFWGMVFSGLIPTFILYVLVYQQMWELGWKIPSRRKLYQEKHSDYKALIIVIVAFVPSFVTLFLWKVFDHFISQIIFRVLNFYSVGFINYAPNYYKLIVLIILLLGIIIGQGGYMLGLRRISLYNKTVYKKQKK